MFALKLLLVPSLIGIITLAGRRWGPAIAGWLSGFPVVAGPILLLVALEQGPSFAAVSAGGALTAVLANVLFCLAYSWAASRFPWWASLAAGLLGYCAAAFLLTLAVLPDSVMFGLTLVALWIASHAFPAVAVRPAGPPSPAELPIRMVAGAVLVVVITVSASALGPRLSGLFSALPLMGSVLAAFSHPAYGAGAAIHLLRGMVAGFYALATFCFTLTFALAAWGVARGFIFALGCALAVQLGSLWLRSSILALNGLARPE